MIIDIRCYRDGTGTRHDNGEILGVYHAMFMTMEHSQNTIQVKRRFLWRDEYFKPRETYDP